MNISYSILGEAGRFTTLDSSSLSAAINYNPSNSDNYSSSDISRMNKSNTRKSMAASMLSSVAQEGASYGTYRGITSRIRDKVKSKGNYLFVVTIGLRESDHAPTRIMSTDRIQTATPESKARFMSIVDRQCNSGKISCASISPITDQMINVRVYIIARVK